MQTLRLTRPHLVIMVGLPGSGKSFFAERFAETFSVPLVSWDLLRRELFNQPTHSAEENEIIDRVAAALTEQLFKTGATILSEGGVLSLSARRAVAARARAAGYEPVFVWVQTDEATARSRAKKNNLPEGVFIRDVRAFTPLRDSEPTVVVSGKHTYASQLKVVLKHLSAPRAEASATPKRPATTTPGRRIDIG